MERVRYRNAVRSFTLVFAVLLLGSGVANAQEISDKKISIGAILGDPLGVTMKYRLSQVQAFDIDFGPDYFGSPRLQIDYVREFDSFHSNVVRTYAGPGLAVAFAKGINLFYTKEPFHGESFSNLEDKGFGVGGRAVFGMNITPKRSPIEFFIEAGLLVGINHYFDPDCDAGIGLRYNL